MKIVYISPHLSTGGCPQFLLKKIQMLHKDHEVHCIEYNDHGCFTVQKNQIKEILGDRLYRVNDRKEELLEIIGKVQPDVVHLEEMPEYFMDKSIAMKLYAKDRKYKLIETSHDSSFDPRTKGFFPDRFIFVSKFQEENMKVLGIPSEVCEYPIVIIPRKPREEALRVLGQDPKKKHIVHVGLFTPRKNQAEIIDYAKSLINYPVQFHFVGNQAENFKFYWEPLMKNFPKNCTWWNERKDVGNFYQMADLFLFPSKDGIGDKETSPLVIREAISYNIPTLIYNSPVYMGMYDKFDGVEYLDQNSKDNNAKKILEMLNIDVNDIIPIEEERDEDIKIDYDRADNKINIYSRNQIDNALLSIKELDSKQVLYASPYNPLHKDIKYWIIPVPKGFMDFETDKYFGGILVELYSGEKLIYSKEFRIKYPDIVKPSVVLKNNTSPSYSNYMEFFVHKIYDRYLANKKFDTVVDVGANIGLWAEYIRRASTCQKIYAVEPNIQALEILTRSFTNNEFIVVDKALTDKDGELEFFVDNNNSTIGATTKQGSLQNSYKVKAVSFKTFLHENNIKHVDLFKMDIEGGEYSFFESMQREDLDKISNLMIEFHLGNGRTMEKDVAILEALFRGAGFKNFVSKEHDLGGFVFATK
jgi:FkbM family methyltransferase